MPRAPDDSQWFAEPNDAVWLKLLEPMLQADASLADTAGRLWCYLIEQIKSGPDGITRACQALEDGLRLTFQFSEVHKDCRTLFEMSMAGHLPPEIEPGSLLKDALERSREAGKGRGRKAGTKNR